MLLMGAPIFMLPPVPPNSPFTLSPREVNTLLVNPVKSVPKLLEKLPVKLLKLLVISPKNPPSLPKLKASADLTGMLKLSAMTKNKVKILYRRINHPENVFLILTYKVYHRAQAE
ncbi:MAG: hypothetical protein AAF569_01165 [Pseudomonadota bacterium]